MNANETRRANAVFTGRTEAEGELLTAAIEAANATYGEPGVLRFGCCIVALDATTLRASLIPCRTGGERESALYASGYGKTRIAVLANLIWHIGEDRAHLLMREKAS